VADESDLEKTEAATPKRLEKAREDGQVARSRELATFALLAAGFGGIWAMSGAIGRHLLDMLGGALRFDHASAFDTNRMLSEAGVAGRQGLLALAPVFALTSVAAVAGPLALGGWLLSLKPLEPKFSRINPMSGLGRMFSPNVPIQLGLSFGKAALIGTITAMVIWQNKDAVIALAILPLNTALEETMRLIFLCCATAVGSMLLIAAADVPYQLWQHAKKLRMTKEEVKREHRESDGDPQVKARIRQQQRALARKRMMAAIPRADVVVTNPTHFSVALQYADGAMGAPKVVAKGSDLVALRIRELAAEHHIPLLEAPPLARALYYNVKVDQEIPTTLYAAVAEVLAWVYQLRRFYDEGGTQPVEPTDLNVPTGMDLSRAERADAAAAVANGAPDAAGGVGPGAANATNGTDGTRAPGVGPGGDAA
jgi:flagellar biosynthetic protein FlhB